MENWWEGVLTKIGVLLVFCGLFFLCVQITDLFNIGDKRISILATSDAQYLEVVKSEFEDRYSDYVVKIKYVEAKDFFKESLGDYDFILTRSSYDLYNLVIEKGLTYHTPTSTAHTPVVLAQFTDDIKVGNKTNQTFQWTDMEGFSWTHPKIDQLEGLSAILSIFYTFKDDSSYSGLTLNDITDGEFINYAKEIEKKVAMYGSTDMVWEKIKMNEVSFDAFVTTEQKILAYEKGQGRSLTPYYPNATMFADYPMAFLEGSDLTVEEYDNFVNLFQTEPVQAEIAEEGFRVSDINYDMATFYETTKANLVSMLEIQLPSYSILEMLQLKGGLFKKNVDMVLCVDLSGSMGSGAEGTKLGEVKEALLSFVEMPFSQEDTLTIVVFGNSLGDGVSDILERVELSDENKNKVQRTIQDMGTLDSATGLYDGIAYSISRLNKDKAKDFADRNQVIIALTDGIENDSWLDAKDLQAYFSKEPYISGQDFGLEGNGLDIILVGIAFGQGADVWNIEKVIPENDNFSFVVEAKEMDIKEVYKNISAYF